MALGWLWVACSSSSFKVRGSTFEVRRSASGRNLKRRKAACRPSAASLVDILLGRAEAGGAPGILKVIPHESRNRNQISLNAETQRARKSAEEKIAFLPLSLRSSANLCVSALIPRGCQPKSEGRRPKSERNPKS